MASPVSSSIGMVMTTGNILVDGSQVPGSSAIFSGSRISSGERSSNIQFSDGTSAVMRPGATMTVYREHSVLQRGVAMQRGIDKHAVSAGELKISGTTPHAAVLIGVKDALHIEVAAQEGESEVRTSSGNLVARVEPGKPMSFTIKDAAGSPANGAALYGVLQPHYLLTDETTNVTYQLQGENLEPLVGTAVQVTGNVLGSSSSAVPEVLAVSNITHLNPSVAMATGQDTGTGAPPDDQNEHRKRRGAIVFLIFVAVGATLLGIGASGGLSTSPSAVTPVSP